MIWIVPETQRHFETSWRNGLVVFKLKCPLVQMIILASVSNCGMHVPKLMLTVLLHTIE